MTKYFKIRRFGERFWVCVTHTDSVSGTVVGMVDSNLSCNPQFLKSGDQICFLEDEVLEVLHKPEGHAG